MDECAAYFTKLWNERVNAAPRNDLISMLAHSDATRHMDPDNLMGNIILLIVGGNDTTRNTITGSVLALNQNPDQYDKLRANPGADRFHGVGSHPLADAAGPYAAHRAGRYRIRRQDDQKGDRVVMWYVSGNRDDEVIEHPNAFIIDRAAAAQPPVVRLRHPSLRRHAAGRTAAEDHLGGDPEALRPGSRWSASRSGSIPASCGAIESCRCALRLA